MRPALLLPLMSMLAGPVLAQTARPADEPAIVPQVDRRSVPLPRYPSRDFEIGLFAGMYSTQNFGSAPVVGLRLAYHLSEDWFVEGAYGSTTASDSAFRQVLPGGGVFPNETERLTYYNLSAGWNVLPGEVFLGSRQARASALYLIGGIGNTTLVAQKHQTFNLGVGLRVLVGERGALRLDVRDHLYSMDLLGERNNTQNFEISAGYGLHF